MDIILKEYVKGLGEKGDLVTVKNGYGRNFLIPKGVAIIATPSNKKVIAENLKQAAHRLEHVKELAEKLAEKIKKNEIVIETLAGQDGKLFGSVTSLMVANKLKEKGIELDRRRISFPEDVKELGTFNINIDLHKEVKVEVPMKVVSKDR